MKGGQVSPEAAMALNEMRQRTSAQEYGRFILEALKSTGLVGRPFNETPIGQAAALRGQPLEQQLAVSENDPAFGFAGTTVGKGIRAFHGSPHSFDKFDLGKIGTGEGAQAYGHGLYFAEAEDVARSYRDALSNGDWLVGGQKYDAKNLDHRAAVEASAYPSADAAARDIQSKIGEYQKIKADWAPDAVASLERILGRIKAGNLPKVEELSSGHMYEVNINAAPDEFLDWDKPLSEQPKAVRGAISKAYRGRGGLGGLVREMRDDADISAISGEQLYNALSLRLGNDFSNSPVTDALSRGGLPGIKYLDQGSRAAGDGSRNYVVFDPNIVQILRKYGMLPPTVLAGTLDYGNAESQ